MHPRDNDLCIICPYDEIPLLVKISSNERKSLPEIEEEEDLTQKKGQKIIKSLIACFNKKGDQIFTGNQKGIVAVIDTKTLQIIDSMKIPGNAPIKSMHFIPRGSINQFLVNSTDRIIRLCEVGKGVLREFQDPVNKMQWKKCCFSSDGDYIIGGSAQKSQHNIYIWNREVGQLIKTLEGPQEGILDLVWHPTRPIIVSISTTGVAYIWGCTYTENWSAFAPDFKELEENEVYEEKEDEFDIIDEAETVSKKRKIEDDDVDILTVDNTIFGSDDEEEVFFIPTIISKDFM